MLDEKALRKPEWTEGDWITLGDGQPWSFPKPKLREWRPIFTEGRAKFSPYSFPTHGAGYLLKLDELVNTEAGIEQIAKIATLGADLLRQNYSLDDEQLGVLLSFHLIEETGEPDETNRQMWRSICDCAAGLGPKSTPAGSESA
jgi:hypothetical protein